MMTPKKKTGGVPDANQKTPPVVLDRLHGNQNSAPGVSVKEKFWILEETSPAEDSAPAQVPSVTAGLSIVDEAERLLNVGARISERLNELQMVERLANSNSTQTFASPRQRAAKLRGRMMKFSSVYNAAWMVRHYQHASGDPLQKAINDFCVVLARELDQAADKEALLYAVAESLTISPYGVPWEG